MAGAGALLQEQRVGSKPELDSDWISCGCCDVGMQKSIPQITTRPAQAGTGRDGILIQRRSMPCAIFATKCVQRVYIWR